MTSYPDFDTLALATKLKVIVLRRKMNRTQLAKDANISPSSLSRIVGGYERFTQDAAREILLKVSKVLVLKCEATKDEIDQLFELARNALPTDSTLVLEKKRRKLLYLYRPLNRENGELEAEILGLLEERAAVAS
jgi:DNA-binding Xre family transcriptional regulator